MNAITRKRELTLRAAGSLFPALGVIVTGDGTVKTPVLRRPLGPVHGARAEILDGKRIERPVLALNRLLTDAAPMGSPAAMITFADGSYHERRLRAGGGGITVSGMRRAADADARRFNMLSGLS